MKQYLSSVCQMGMAIALLCLFNFSVIAQNNCLHFDGVDDYVDCGAINSAIFSIEAWVYPNILNIDQAIASTLNEVTPAGFELHISTTGQPVFTLRNNTVWVGAIDASTIPINTWTHLAATYDGTSAKLYVNGTLTATETVSDYTTGANSLKMGIRSNAVSTQYFNGSLDEISIWTKALTSAEIQEHMYSNLNVSESELYAYYKFNQGTAEGNNSSETTLTDATSNSIDGTLNNFALIGTSSNWVSGPIKPEPTDHATDFSASLNGGNIELSWTDEPTADAYVILASTTNSFTEPVDGTDIVADNDLSNGSAVVKVSYGTEAYSAFTNIAEGSTYYFRIHAHSNTGVNIDYKTDAAIPASSLFIPKPEPTDHATAFTSSLNGSTIELSWTDEPTADAYVIIASTTNSFTDPVDGADIVTDNDLSDGTAVVKVSYGTQTYSAFTNIAEGSTYYFRIFACSNAGVNIDYKTDATIPANSLFIPKPEPTNHATAFTTSLNGGNIELIWTDEPTADAYVILASTTNSFTDPVDGTDIVADNDLSDGTAVVKVSYGTQTYSAFTNAVDETTYYFRIYAHSNTSVNIDYKTDGTVPETQITKFTPLFIEQTASTFTEVHSGSTVWGDYDNDGDLDILLTGELSSGSKISKIYRNDAGTFTDINAGLTGVSSSVSSSVAWGDYDNDGDLDILLTGSGVANIYRNDAGTFTDINAGLVSLSYGSVAWGDYDNDGFLDIIITGTASGSVPTSKIYRNNGDETFSEQTNIILMGVYESSVAWGDYDNDGFSDILLTGLDAGGVPLSKIYHNNADGTFSEQSDISLIGVRSGTGAWGDYDNDGFLDILLTGGYDDPKAIIYRNTGNSNFSLKTDSSLEGVRYGKSAWGDYDNDGDLDILITGWHITSYSTTRLYLNDSGVFTKIDAGTVGLPDFSSSSVAWGDYDNDGDLDIFIAGYSESSTLISELYINTSTVKNTPPEAPQILNYEINNTNILLKWSKVITDETPVGGISYNLKIGTSSNSNDLKSSQSNNDGYRTIIARGNMQYDTSFIFNNYRWDTTYYPAIQAIDQGFSGSTFTVGNPLIVSAIQLSGLKGTLVNSTSIALNWDRGNGDKCILFAKADADTTHFPIPEDSITYYFNNQFGEGSPIDSTGWNCIYKGVKDSILLTGLDPSKTYKVVGYEFQNTSGFEIYKATQNETNTLFVGTLAFSENTVTSFYNSYYGSVTWGDYDNDGDLDVLLTGEGVSKIYRNDSGLFTDIGTELAGVKYSSADWGDFDNDGDLDILLTGNVSSSNYISKIYSNDAGTFSDINAALTGVSNSSVAWGDYDNDGDLDILLTGSSATGYISKIYRNDMGVFTDINAKLIGMAYGSCIWGDYDNDGDLDILLTGLGNVGDDYYYTTKSYRNDTGIFTEVSLGLTNVSNSSAAWGDYNNDGFLDILLTGNYSGNSYSIVYRNNGNETFSEQTNISLTGTERGSVKWGDYDNDGDLDIFLTGSGISKIYRNDSGSFTDIYAGLPGINYSSIACGDYDNDGDLDILLSGSSAEGNISKIYNNNLYMYSEFTSNTNPVEPTGLYTTISPDKIELNWNPTTDNETYSSALTYNLRYRNQDSSLWSYGCQTVDTTKYGTGHRLLPAMGNIQQNTSYTLKNIAAGTYLWQIQAIDQGYIGSEWSAIDTFEIKNLTTFFTYDTVCARNANTLIDKSTSTKTIVSRKWKHYNSNSLSYETVASDSLASYIFPNAGLDSIMLVIEDADGLKDSLSHNLWIKARSEAKFTAPSVCFNTKTTFTDLCTIPDSIQAWYWDFGDNTSNSNPSNTVQQNYDYTYLAADTLIASLKVIGENGCSDSISQQVIVAPIPDAAIAVSSDSKFNFCENSGDSALLFVTPQANCTYQWLNNNAVITDKTDNKLLIKENGGIFTTIVTDTLGGCSETSNLEINITVNDSPDAPTINTPINTTICESDTVELYVTPINGLTYQWSGGLNANDSNIYCATTSETYSLEVSNASGCKTTSTNTVDVTVNDKPEIIGFSYGDTEFCQGESVTFSVNANSAYSYIWMNNNAQINGDTLNTYTASESGKYKLQISNESNCAVETSTVQVAVHESPTAPLINQPDQTSICEGDTVELYVTPINGLTHQWSGGLNVNESNIYYATTSATYSLEVSNSNGCKTTSTNTVDVTVNDNPEIIGFSYGDTEFCQGESVTFSVNANSAYSYIWMNNNAPVDGATTNKYTTNETGNYWLQVSNGECFATTDSIKVNVYENPPKPTIKEENNNTNYCFGTEVNIMVDNSSTVYNYQWQRSGVYIDGETSSQLSGKLQNGDYSVIATSGVCEATSDILTLTTKSAPDKPDIYASGPVEWVIICDTREAEGYRWYYNGELITGANLSTYFANRNLGEYYFEVNDGGECWTMSDIITIPTGELVVQKSAELVTVSPNPSCNIFKIGLGDDYSGSSKVTVHNSFGRKVCVEEHNGVNEITLDFSKYENGIYLCNVDIDGKIVMIKLIKQ